MHPNEEQLFNFDEVNVLLRYLMSMPVKSIYLRKFLENPSMMCYKVLMQLFSVMVRQVVVKPTQCMEKISITIWI